MGHQLEEAARAVPPMPGLLAHQRHDFIREQGFGRDALHREAVHRLPGLPGAAQQGGTLGGLIAFDLADQRGQTQPARGGIGGGRHIGAIQRIEQSAQRLVQIKVAQHHHARQQQAAHGILFAQRTHKASVTERMARWLGRSKVSLASPKASPP
jgi:hypothetical protein